MLTTIQVICAFNFLLFAGIIFIKKKQLDPSIIIFGFFLLGKGMTLTGSLLIDTFSETNAALFYAGILLNSFLFFYAPFLFLFAKSTSQGPLNSWNYRLHFTPFLSYLVINMVLVGAFSFSPGSHFFEQTLFIRRSFNELYYLQVIIYTSLSFWTLHRQKNKSKKFDQISKWLKQILVVFLLIWFLFLISNYVEDYKIGDSNLFTFSGMLLLLLLSNLTLIFLINNPHYFYNNLSVKLNQEKNKEILSEENYTRLCTIVTQQKLYTNSDLKIGDLSVALGMSTRNTSALISTFYRGNFYDFINFYRIEEAKSLLERPEENTTIQTILFDSGFNSKSVFNSTFKKQVGMTPSAYRKAQLEIFFSPSQS